MPLYDQKISISLSKAEEIKKEKESIKKIPENKKKGGIMSFFGFGGKKDPPQKGKEPIAM